MAHTRDQMRWFEARSMLTELQPAGVEADPQTARGFCLTALVMLIAQEVIDTAQAASRPSRIVRRFRAGTTLRLSPAGHQRRG
jgi:hypothetical protein